MTINDYLKDYLIKMMEFREAAGYATTTYKATLMPFIDFCCSNYKDAGVLTSDMLDAWLSYKGYTINTQAAFIACLRQYCRYINFLGREAYIPDEDYTLKRISYEPCLFTDTELQALFCAIDGYGSSTNNKKYKPEIVISPMFRMMYCCGMRPCEPLRLRCSDVNLDTGDIYIREAKKHKDRHIIMSRDMARLCRKYDGLAGNRTWFFEYDGGPYNRKWMTAQFGYCWKRSGLETYRKLRPYDLRHAFATRNLIRWIDNGLDVNNLLPYLSTYMGHSKLTSTFYYIHLLPERIRNSAGVDWKQFSSIYGKEVAELKVRDPGLYRLMKNFLTVYLPDTKQKSPHTIQAYRDALNLYMGFLDSAKSVKLKDVCISDFNQENISAFLRWLHEECGNESTTVNQRLSHIKGFCRYVQKKDVLSFEAYSEICGVAGYTDDRVKDFIWLAIEDVKLVPRQPDINKKTGIRDRFFIALMYESGCRDDEILYMRLKNIVINKAGEPDAHIFGKGSKHRCTPLSRDIVPYYNEYCRLYHPDAEKNSDELLFYTVRNGIKCQMSQDNVQRFMKTYEKKAQKINAGIPHLHPHLWRRTRAMHLYLAGVPLPLVSEWLGRSNMETTQIYARATDEMKRQAQRKLGEKEGSVFKNDIAFKYADNEAVLKKLAGLK